MELHLLDRASSPDSSFTVTRHRYPNFLKVWHHHPELELGLMRKSKGTRFIGDSIEKFEEGEVILIGKNLPHMWLNDEMYFVEESNLAAEAIVIHLTQDFLGKRFLMAAEMQSISKLLRRADQGIKFMGLDSGVLGQIEGLLNLGSFEKTLKFIEMLNRLSRHENYKLLSSTGFVSSFKKTEDENLDKIYAYIFKNFNGPIRSKDVAEVAHMNASAFSRFFKRVHRKTFTKYLNEIRKGYSCKLLMERKNTIASICYESGFNNISNFNRQFKTIVGMSPTEYLRLYT